MNPNDPEFMRSQRMRQARQREMQREYHRFYIPMKCVQEKRLIKSQFEQQLARNNAQYFTFPQQ